MGNNGGTAFVRINGKRVYLGKFGTAEANQNYARRVAEWATTGTTPGQSTQPIGTTAVNSLAIAFLDHIQWNDPSHYHPFRSAVRGLLQLYSGIAVDSGTTSFCCSFREKSDTKVPSGQKAITKGSIKKAHTSNAMNASPILSTQAGHFVSQRKR